MENILEIASYFCKYYKVNFGIRIDEVKLNELLYLTQRESLIQFDIPLFIDSFSISEKGPETEKIKRHYKDYDLETYELSNTKKNKYKTILEMIIHNYIKKDAKDLIILVNGEYSWRKAVENCQIRGNLNMNISLNDIRVDARRIKTRRILANLVK